MDIRKVLAGGPIANLSHFGVVGNAALIVALVS